MNNIEKINLQILEVKKQLQIVEMAFDESSPRLKTFVRYNQIKKEKLNNKLNVLLDRLHNYMSAEGDYMLKNELR